MSDCARTRLYAVGGTAAVLAVSGLWHMQYHWSVLVALRLASDSALRSSLEAP